MAELDDAAVADRLAVLDFPVRCGVIPDGENRCQNDAEWAYACRTRCGLSQVICAECRARVFGRDRRVVCAHCKTVDFVSALVTWVRL